MYSPKEHIEEIRRVNYSAGGKPNPLGRRLDEVFGGIYTLINATYIRFVIELIQNAEDNQYDEGVNPALEFVITSDDITATGAQATLLVFNNGKGFSPTNIDSICGIALSTKNTRSTGEKGIGFKSVFAVTPMPYLFSNGYQIRFNEKPCPNCHLRYVVPEWVEDKTILADINKIYGKDSLPTTIIVLPLKSDKVAYVKQELLNIRPEVLLFLTKIRHLSIRIVSKTPTLVDTLYTLSVSSKINSMTMETMNAESYTLRLSARLNSNADKECSYTVWRQKFPIRSENVLETTADVEVRQTFPIRSENVLETTADVEEWAVTLAFPYQEELHIAGYSPGVYAYLPTTMVTGFPFIIQADFITTPTRGVILFDNEWNQGILECVPAALVDAFKTLTIGLDGATSSLARMFRFLPFESSPFLAFNYLTEKIIAKFLSENTVPIETYTEQQFCKAGEVSRLLPEFRNILDKARDEGVNLPNLSSHDGRKILSSSFDKSEYDQVLNLLGLKFVNIDWYAACIKNSNLVDRISEDLYLELLMFLVKNWFSMFKDSNMKSIPLIKYVASDETQSSFSIHECTQDQTDAKRVVTASRISGACNWLIFWNNKFSGAGNWFFIPESTQKAISHFTEKYILMEWLEAEVYVTDMDVYTFAKSIFSCIKNDSPELIITYASFLESSLSKGYLKRWVTQSLCQTYFLLLVKFIKYHSNQSHPINEFVYDIKNVHWLMTSYGLGSLEGSVLAGTEWQVASEISQLPFIDSSYYGDVIYEYKEELELLGVKVGLSGNYEIVIKHLKSPNNLASLTVEAVLLIMQCIRFLNDPSKLLDRLKGTSCLKTNLGFKIPSECFLSEQLWSCFVDGFFGDLPVIDKTFYGEKIFSYKDELRQIGVVVDFEDAIKKFASHLCSLSNSDDIVKMYRYLSKSKYNWKPEKKDSKKIWIPNGIEGGKWVNSEECIIHDPDNFFSLKFHVLDHMYDTQILSFLTSSMEVRTMPSLDDYIDIWNGWEIGSSKELSYDECHKFWLFILKQHMDNDTVKKLSEKLIKLPVTTGSNKIILLDKKDVFIPDDRDLENLFEHENVFAWYPQKNCGLTLYDIYQRIGARNISESICKEEFLVNDDGVEMVQVDRNILNLNGLVKLILGFLACSSLKMNHDKRHEAVKGLVSLSFFETKVPATVSYSLSLSSGDIITKKDDRMFHWDRQSSKFFIHKIEEALPHEKVSKYASQLSEIISKGVLSENHGFVPDLSNLILMAFVLKLENANIESLMKTWNLHISSEDEMFLSSAFPPHRSW